MRLTSQLNIEALLLLSTWTLVACDGLSGKKAKPAPTTDAYADYGSATEAYSANSSGSVTDPALSSSTIPGLDKSCTSKDNCTPATVDLIVEPGTLPLTGVLGKAVTWQLTAVDTKTIGGVVTPLPAASATGSSSNDSGTSAWLAQVDPATPIGIAPLPGAAASNTSGGKSARHVVMILSNLPADATVTPISLGKPVVTATINWIPTVAGSRSINVTLRDYDRCLVTEADQTACERSTPLPAYDTQHAPIQVTITDPKPKCTPVVKDNGIFGGLFGGSTPTATGC